MANFFDQFDRPQPTAAETSGPNFFDQFDVANAARPAPSISAPVPSAVPKTGMPSASAPLFMGIRDKIDAGAQLLARGIAAIAPAGSSVENWAKGQSDAVDASIKDANQEYNTNQFDGAQPPAFQPGRMAGGILADLPLTLAMPGASAAGLLPRMASGAASGAVSNVLQPVTATDPEDFWKQKAKDAGVGAAAGAATTAVMSGLARLIRPNTSDQVETLMANGVRPTPGQILGGSANRIEEAAQSIPLAGDAIKNARFRAVGQFDRAAINQALTPIGESLGEKTPLGREAISEAADKISGAYDKLVPQLAVKADPQFLADATKLTQMAQFMPAERAGQFNKVFNNEILSKFSPNGTMTGESFKEVESTLGRLASQYSHSSVVDEQQFGGALKQLQSTMRDLLTRSNPDRAAELSGINTAYANLLRVQGAAGRIGAQEGVFTPAQLLAETRALDPTMRKSAFAQGNALMQDFAEAGKTVLGNKVPDSGTPLRSAVTGAIGLAGLYGVRPEAAMAAGAGGLGVMGLYSPWAQAAMAHMLASRPEGAAAVAQGVRDLAPVASVVTPRLFSGGGGLFSP